MIVEPIIMQNPKSHAAKSRRMHLRGAVIIVLALLRRVSNEWAEELLQFRAAACRAFDSARLMLLQCHHYQGFLSTV